MKEKDYINVAHLAALRCANAALMQLTPSLLATDEERQLLADTYKSIDKLIENIRKRIDVK